MAFYNFRQNNSGGSFDFDKERGISVSVIIEAPNFDVANIRAEFKGLYFDGCSKGIDCSCCGDRWYPQYDDKFDVSEEPSVYGIPVTELKDGHKQKNETPKWMKKGLPDVFVHYEDGRIVGFFE